MRFPRHAVIVAALSLAGAGLFARLGVWQVSRLKERRSFNAHLEARLAAAPVPVRRLPPDTSAGHFRRATATGSYDFAVEVALAPRSRDGSPGVHLLTPMRLADGGMVIVNRGWVYSEDAKTVDFERWHEYVGDTITVVGYAETWKGRAVGPRTPRILHALDSAGIALQVGVPVLPYYLVQTSDSALAPTRPARLGEPALDEGSHKSYAIQWFSFALIAMIGGALLVREELIRRRVSA